MPPCKQNISKKQIELEIYKTFELFKQSKSVSIAEYLKSFDASIFHQETYRKIKFSYESLFKLILFQYLKGIKFHTAAGFYPNDEACYPIYEKALDYGVPVLLHTGEVLKPLYFKYCQPIYVQEVAMDFPDLPIILAHAGGCWYSEAVAVCNSTTNVYLDVSVWQSRLLRPLEFYKALRTLLDSVSWQRVLFGSDYPFLKLLVNQGKWVKAFTEIPDSVKEQGIKFRDEEIEGIIGGNAAKILGLTE